MINDFKHYIYLKTCCGSLQTKTMQIKNLASINAFLCTFITKKQSLQNSQRYTLLRKMAKNIHGNVIHIANLLTSIEDKKL